MCFLPELVFAALERPSSLCLLNAFLFPPAEAAEDDLVAITAVMCLCCFVLCVVGIESEVVSDLKSGIGAGSKIWSSRMDESVGIQKPKVWRALYLKPLNWKFCSMFPLKISGSVSQHLPGGEELYQGLVVGPRN